MERLRYNSKRFYEDKLELKYHCVIAHYGCELAIAAMVITQL